MFRTFKLTSTAVAACLALTGLANAQPMSPPPGEEVTLDLAQTPQIAPADAKAQAIVEAAQGFLDTLSAEERDAVVFAFDDDEKRANWSNLPISFVERGGLAREDLSDDQLAALDALLAEVLSADGVRNAQLQRYADGQLTNGGPVGNGDVLEFGEELYYIALLGEPSVDTPWMLQYGGHHLAINATFAGGQATFSPMLTGGQPLTVEYEGESVYITAAEVDAARAFMDSLDEAQRASAIVSDQSIQLLLGPGAYGTTVAPEGISASALDDTQKEALVAVVAARIGQLNDRDAQVVMTQLRDGLDETTFGWWGPQEPYGAAYFRVVGPQIMLEYSPQEQGGDTTEHTHNMYRDPTNDYGSAWVGEQQ